MLSAIIATTLLFSHPKGPILTISAPERVSSGDQICIKASFENLNPTEALRVYRFVPGQPGSFHELYEVVDPLNARKEKNGPASGSLPPILDQEFAPGIVGFGIETFRRPSSVDGSDEQNDGSQKKTDTYKSARQETVVYIDGRSSDYKNGIVVGDLKQYNETSLLMMMQSFNSQLQGLSLIGGPSITSAIGQYQGATAASNWAAFQLAAGGSPQTATTVTQPSTTIASTLTPNQTVVTGASQYPGTNTTTYSGPSVVTTQNPLTNQSVTTQAAFAPTPPSAPTSTPPFSFAPTLGPGGSGILAEQVELTYDIINLQMLLEGSLTDRFYSSPSPTTGGSLDSTRYRAVIGIPITIMPSKRYKNAVAEVEVGLITDGQVDNTKSEGDLGKVPPPLDPPSVIALIPMQNSYNVAKETTDANSFGIAGALSVVSAGISVGNSNQTIYLVKDSDTLAEGFPKDNDFKSGRIETRFGWQFRPVLGESTIRAGMRTMLASLALPASMKEGWIGHAHVTTRWRKFDPKAKWVGDEIPGSCQVQDIQGLNFPVGYLAEEEGGAATYASAWEDAGDGKSATVTVDGESFASGTFVQAGPLTLTPTTGLNLTQRSLTFTMPANLFGNSDPYIVNPFGTSIEIRSRASTRRAMAIKLTSSTWKALDQTNGLVTITAYAPASPYNQQDDERKPGSMSGAYPKLVGPADAPNPHEVNAEDADTSVRLLALLGGTTYGLQGNPLIVKYKATIYNSKKPTLPVPLEPLVPDGWRLKAGDVQTISASTPLGMSSDSSRFRNPTIHRAAIQTSRTATKARTVSGANSARIVAVSVAPIAEAQAVDAFQRATTEALHRTVDTVVSNLKAVGVSISPTPFTDLDEYEISFMAPLTALKASQNVQVVMPLWGETSMTSVALQATATPSASLLSDDGRTSVWSLSVGTDTRWPFALYAGKKRVCLFDTIPGQVNTSGQPARRDKLGPFTFELPSKEVHALQQLTLMRWTAATNDPNPDPTVPTTAPSLPYTWTPTAISLSVPTPPTLSVEEAIHVGDEFHVTITGADLSNVERITCDGYLLQMQHSNLDLKVMLNRNITRLSGMREFQLTYQNSHNSPVFVPFQVLPNPLPSPPPG